MKKEIIDGEFFPKQKSKQRLTSIVISHTKPINRQKIFDFLLKQGSATVQILTYKNAVLDTKELLK